MNWNTLQRQKVHDKSIYDGKYKKLNHINVLTVTFPRFMFLSQEVI